MKRKICFIFELLLKIATIIFAFWECVCKQEMTADLFAVIHICILIISNLETVIIFSVFTFVLRIAENIKGNKSFPNRCLCSNL